MIDKTTLGEDFAEFIAQTDALRQRLTLPLTDLLEAATDAEWLMRRSGEGRDRTPRIDLECHLLDCADRLKRALDTFRGDDR